MDSATVKNTAERRSVDEVVTARDPPLESVDRVALWNLVCTVDAFLSSGFSPAEDGNHSTPACAATAFSCSIAAGR